MNLQHIKPGAAVVMQHIEGGWCIGIRDNQMLNFLALPKGETPGPRKKFDTEKAAIGYARAKGNGSVWRLLPGNEIAIERDVEEVAENVEECRNCGEEIDRDGVGVVPNDSPYGVMGYFCDENCHVSAGEAQDQRRMEEV